jgi:hypothetical protein
MTKSTNGHASSRVDPHAVSGGTAARIRALRINSFAAVVMLVTEYGLGIWVNIYAHLPAADQGKGTFAAFASAVANGPVVLALHAVLGTLILVSGISMLVRAALVGRPALIVIGAVGLLAIIAAWFSGARFVGHGGNGASFSMAIATAVAIAGYVIVLFISGPGNGAPTAAGEK